MRLHAPRDVAAGARMCTSKPGFCIQSTTDRPCNLQVAADGAISTIAGTGTCVFNVPVATGAVATSTGLPNPVSIALDSAGAVYFGTSTTNPGGYAQVPKGLALQDLQRCLDGAPAISTAECGRGRGITCQTNSHTNPTRRSSRSTAQTASWCASPARAPLMATMAMAPLQPRS
jgi:hypothetical protein